MLPNDYKYYHDFFNVSFADLQQQIHVTSPAPRDGYRSPVLDGPWGYIIGSALGTGEIKKIDFLFITAT